MWVSDDVVKLSAGVHVSHFASSSGPVVRLTVGNV